MKILTVIGARPQFIKAAAFSNELLKENQGYENNLIIEEVIVHTGQHYDLNMSDIFFDQLSIPKPKYNLGAGGKSQAFVTGTILIKLEQIILDESPDCVLLYGDTNSTLAGALCSSKLNIPVVHVEAGLRSFNMKMPEEINRIITDRLSDLLFCPSQESVKNLISEGITQGVYVVGDIMLDASLMFKKIALNNSQILDDNDLVANNFVLATFHRAENTDNPLRLAEIIEGILKINDLDRVVIPLHPRTRRALEDNNLIDLLTGLKVIEPVSYFDMITLEESSKVILTDSGGVQKEAFFFSTPCITLRDETEWVETVKEGGNKIVGADSDKIFDAYIGFLNQPPLENNLEVYGDGKTAKNIIDKLREAYK